MILPSIEEAHVWHEGYGYEFIMEVWGVEDDYDVLPMTDMGFKTHEMETESEPVAWDGLPKELQDELEKDAICEYESELYDGWEY